MKHTTKIIIILLLMMIKTFVAFATSDEVPVRRYLLSAGANNGGKGKVVLRYAVSDANAFASVLIDMGGVDRGDALILPNPTARELLGGVSRLGSNIAAGKAEAPAARNEVFVYYSGHADAHGLKLGGETLPWADFRNAVDGLDADVKVAVVDACGSGAITRAKGGVARPVFMSDASSNMKGYAYLTSSNENEASQESDLIRGSFFTHALVSGMRGAADMTGSRKVTVNEAYQYAFNETLQNTQNTTVGTQHPSRDMNLTGTGDIVMTDLRQTSALLSLDPDIEGRFFIRDESQNLVAELRKTRGRAIELGVPPGKYNVQMEAPSKMWSAGDVAVTDGGKTVITMNDMKPMGARRRTTARGSVDGVDYYDDNDGDDVYYIDDENDHAAASAQPLPPPSSTPISNDTGTDTLTPAESITTALDSACAAPYRFNGNFIVISDKPESGVQLSFMNAANAHYCGTQIAFANSLNKESKGAQIGFFNMSKEIFDGMQIGYINVAHDVGYGQIGFVNAARDVKYGQAGFVNAARDAEYGQAGYVNVARDVKYGQAGFVNTARDVGYGQVGFVNVARDAGRQIGFVNVARYSEKTPVGFLNIIGNGIIDLTAYMDGSGEASLSLRTGMPWFYTVIEYGQPGGISEFWPKTFGCGFGTRFGMNGPVAFNIDFVGSHLYERELYQDLRDIWRDGNREYRDEYDNWYSRAYKLRLGASIIPLPYLAVTGGVSANGHIESGGGLWKKPKQLGSWYSRGWYNHETKRQSRVHVWPGLYAGVTAGKVQAGKKN